MERHRNVILPRGNCGFAVLYCFYSRIVKARVLRGTPFRSRAAASNLRSLNAGSNRAYLRLGSARRSNNSIERNTLNKVNILYHGYRQLVFRLKSNSQIPRYVPVRIWRRILLI